MLSSLTYTPNVNAIKKSPEIVLIKNSTRRLPLNMHSFAHAFTKIKNRHTLDLKFVANLNFGVFTFVSNDAQLPNLIWCEMY